MARLDPDAIEDALRVLVDKLLRDCRTVSVALRLEDLRRDIGRILAVDETAPRRVDPGTQELARCEQVAARPQLHTEASVFAHGGRFAEVYAG